MANSERLRERIAGPGKRETVIRKHIQTLENGDRREWILETLYRDLVGAEDTQAAMSARLDELLTLVRELKAGGIAVSTEAKPKPLTSEEEDEAEKEEVRAMFAIVEASFEEAGLSIM
jgi:hypothetical protein